MTRAFRSRLRAVSLLMPAWTLGLLAVLLLAAAPRGAVGQTSTFLDEDFEAYDEGDTSPGDGSWSASPPSDLSGYFEVRDVSGDKVFGGNDLDGDAVWETRSFDISNYSSVSFSLNLTEKGDLEDGCEPCDYADVAYSTDGGSSFTTITDWNGNGDSNHTLVGNWTEATVSQSNLSGTSFVLRVTMNNNTGSEDIRLDDVEITGQANDPVVQFTVNSGTANENEGSTALAVEIRNSPSDEITADVAFKSGASTAGSEDIGDYSTQTVTFPSGVSDKTTKTVSVPLNGDGTQEGSEVAVFEVQNVSGSASVGFPAQFDLTIEDAVSDHAGDILITELSPNPGGSDSGKEYIELYNATGSDITLDNWTLKEQGGDDDDLSGVTVPARGFAVLCEDDDPSSNGGINNCDFDYVNGITLVNSGDEIIIEDNTDSEVDRVNYDGGMNWPDPDGQSMIFTGTTDNNNGDNWTLATERERGYTQDQSGDDGSPGRNGTGQTLQPTAEITGSADWRMLSAPIGGITPGDLADVSLVQGVSGLPFSGAASNLYQWPGGPDDQNTDWTTPSSSTTDLTSSGQGFIWFIFDAAETKFTDTPPFTLSVPGSPRTSTVTTNSLGNGFHLLGNPYAQSIDPASVDFGGQGFQTTVQIYDPSSGGYTDITTPYTADDFIGAYQGFFVERTSSGNTDLVFNAEDRVADPISLKSTEGAPPRIEFQLVGRDGEGSVLTRDEALTLHAPEGATADWDVHDASKLTPLTGRYATAAFQGSLNGETRLQSVMSVPSALPDGGVEVPVSLKLQGTDPVETLRLSWPSWTNVPDHWGLALHDAVTDSTVNLRTHSSYAFILPQSKAQTVPPPRSPMELPGQIRAKAQSDSARFTLTVQPNPIPVELTDFGATVSGETAQLTWTTASETDNAGFHVEHRGPESDGFASTGFVEGHGTTDRAQQYRFRTDPLDPGRHVFRLRQVDLDGTATRSDTVAVRVRLATAAEVEVAPNPVRTRATVSLRVRAEQEVEVALYDVLGRRVRTVHEGPLAPGRAHTLQVGAGGLSSGLYLLRADGEQFQTTHRVTVVR